MSLETRIEELPDKYDIEDSNLFIVEDDEDTKKATIEELKKAFLGDDITASRYKFYSSQYMETIIAMLRSSISSAATSEDLEALSKRVAQIVAGTSEGKDSELVDARDGEVSLHERILRDYNILNDIKLSKLSQATIDSGNPLTIKNPKLVPLGFCTINVTYPELSNMGTLTIKDGSNNITKNIMESDVPFEYILESDTCEFSCDIPDSNISVSYNSYTIDTQYLLNKINTVSDEVYDTKDQCGLIEDYGTYIYPTDLYVTDDEAATYELVNDKIRDGRNSLRIRTRIDAKTNPRFTVQCNPINFNLFSVVFYVSKEIINAFDSTNGITIKLSSDSPLVIPSNYYMYDITSKEMVNGWNCLKKPLRDFVKVGTPDSSVIRTIRIEINRNDQINNKDIYISSFIFNQRMKPTILLNFNGIYDESFTYTYPYLQTRKLPCTVFTNNGTTLTKDEKAEMCKARFRYGWDIAPYGCHPNKEILLETENEYDQYVALCATKEYIETNFRQNITSYSAPYGNLQDITIPILKDLGYKVARVENSKHTYCSFFGKNDFCMPVVKVGNQNMAEDIIEQIDYIIETGQTMALFTNNVTEYGDESSLKEITFETVLDYVLEKIDAGELQVMTFESFYKACVE